MTYGKWILLARRISLICMMMCLLCMLSACGNKNANSSSESNASNASNAGNSSTVSSDLNQRQGNGTQFPGEIRETIGGIPTGEHKVIATVNGEDIYEDVFTEWFLETMSLNLNLDMSVEQDEQVVSYLNEYKEGYLIIYAEQVAMLQEALKDGISVDDEAVDSYQDMLMGMYAEDEEQFQPVLTMWGFSAESLRSFLWEKMLIQYFYEDMTGNITEPSISPSDYYTENPVEFAVDETRTVRHILVASLDEAHEIIGELDKGADFADFVERSMDTGSIPSGGVIGPFYPSGLIVGGGALVTAFTDATYALGEVGDYTQEPAESEYGFHIIILDEITEPYTLSFDEIEDDLHYYLLNTEKEAFFEAYIQEIIDQADITYVQSHDEE